VLRCCCRCSFQQPTIDKNMLLLLLLLLQAHSSQLRLRHHSRRCHQAATTNPTREPSRRNLRPAVPVAA
jgi:hypothetical protein